MYAPNNTASAITKLKPEEIPGETETDWKSMT